MVRKHPKFSERTQRMRKAAIELTLLIKQLSDLRQVFAEQANHMTVADTRSGGRRANGKPKAGR